MSNVEGSTDDVDIPVVREPIDGTRAVIVHRPPFVMVQTHPTQDDRLSVLVDKLTLFDGKVAVFGDRRVEIFLILFGEISPLEADLLTIRHPETDGVAADTQQSSLHCVAVGVSPPPHLGGENGEIDECECTEQQAG